MYALIESQAIVSVLYGENVWHKLPNGDYVSPIFNGWEKEEYKILKVEENPPEIDPETEEYKINPFEQWVIHSDRVEATYTVNQLPQTIPEIVSRAQGKAALVLSGLWDSIVSYVESMEDATQKAMAEIALFDTTEWHRDSPTLGQLAAALSISSSQLDDLFILAASIEL